MQALRSLAPWYHLFLVRVGPEPQEVFIAEVEILREQMSEKDITIEGEFMSDAMMEDNGISESSVHSIRHVQACET